MMTDINSVVFVGGDKRMSFAAEKLGRLYKCSVYAGTPTELSDCAVLSMRPTPSDIGVLPRVLRDAGLVFAGSGSELLAQMCELHGYELFTYLDREELAVANAQLTAEGAVAETVGASDFSVCGSEVLITGFGRIAKLTARYLDVIGAHITVAVRRPEAAAWAAALGYNAVSLLDDKAFGDALSRADIILNTVPAPILAGERAGRVRPGTVLIELASSPCTDGQTRFRVIAAGGLPGKTAPKAAGGIIADTVVNILNERSLKNGGA